MPSLRVEKQQRTTTSLFIFRFPSAPSQGDSDHSGSLECLSPLDNPNGNQIELRTAILAQKLAFQKADTAVFSEILFAKQGKLDELGAHFWSGRPKAERRAAGLAFFVFGSSHCQH
nr:unnamed protein product [Spirometra erinaceieuropaei]